MSPVTRTISVRVPETLAAALDVIADESGLSISVLTRRAVEEYYEKIISTGKIELSYTINVSGKKNSGLKTPAVPQEFRK